MPDLRSVYRKSIEDEQQRSYDPIVHGVTNAELPRRLIHDAMWFYATGKETGFIDGSSVNFHVRSLSPSPIAYVQALNLALGRGDIDVQIFEGATISVLGTPLQGFNANRAAVADGAGAGTLQAFLGPTITDDGDEIFNLWVPPTASGQGNSSSGIFGVGQQGEELVLAQDTDYLFRITNNSGETIDWWYEFNWYEVTYPEDRTALDP